MTNIFITQYSSAFNMATDLAMDPEYQLFVSNKCYEAAYDLLVSEALRDQAPDQLAQVHKRLGNIRNEMGVYYMNQAAAMQTENEGMLQYNCSYNNQSSHFITHCFLPLCVCSCLTGLLLLTL